MKEYRVFQVRCEKGTTIHNLFSLIDKEVVYHDVFFELSGVHSGRAAKQPFNTSSEFYHSFQANDHNNNIWKVFPTLTIIGNGKTRITQDPYHLGNCTI